MNREEYRRAMKQIKPSEGKKEEVWEKLTKESSVSDTGNKRKLPKWSYSVAAIFVICALILPGSAFADEVKELFTGFLQQEESVNQYVEENIYEDSDEHLKIQVTELLSDEMTVLATVKYDALDEEGVEQLKLRDRNASVTEKRINGKVMGYYNLDLMPGCGEDTGGYHVGGYNGYSELMEYRADHSRVYLAVFSAANWDSSMKNCDFSYGLTDGEKKTVVLNTSANVPVYEYHLKAKDGENLSQYYEPTDIRLSKLSYVVYGKQNGLFKSENKENTNYYRDMFLLSDEQLAEEEIVSCSFLDREGKIVFSDTMPNGPGGISEQAMQSGDGYDCVVCNQEMQNIFDRTIREEEKENGDPEEISGILITRSGKDEPVEYEFIKK